MRNLIPWFCLWVMLVGLAVPGKSQPNAPRFEPATVVSTSEPVYPPNAINPGTVVLEVTVGTEGQVEDVKTVRAAPPFTQEALNAIKKWKFAPARLDGQPVRSVVPVAFSFSRPTVWWPQTKPTEPGANR